MNLNNFTIKAQESVAQAFTIATAGGQQAIECAHLMKGIISESENIVEFLFGRMGVDLMSFSKAVDQMTETFPKVSGGEPYLSTKASEALRKANDHASKMKDKFVSVEHILLGILDTDDKVSELMKDRGFTIKDLKAAITEIRKGSTINSQTPEDMYNSFGRYANNLNEMVLSGKLDPVIGRDDEIRRLLQILTRRTKNNPLLISEPGVGRTAITEGLAGRIVRGDVPEDLKSKWQGVKILLLRQNVNVLPGCLLLRKFLTGTIEIRNLHSTLNSSSNRR